VNPSGRNSVVTIWYLVKRGDRRKRQDAGQGGSEDQGGAQPARDGQE